MMPAAHAIMDRYTTLIVSRHPDRDSARAAWRRDGTAPSPCGLSVTRWGDQHCVVPLARATRLVAQREGGKGIRVTGATHPAVHSAFSCLSLDAGETPRFEYVVPRRYGANLACAEAALGALDAEGFQTVVLGAPGAARAMAKGNVGLQRTLTLLNSFFRDWHPPRRKIRALD